MKSYKELVVWQKSYQLCILVYKITRSFPKEELYGLISQIRRASIAIPSNIAEGYCRSHRLEYLQFLKIAFASGAELETQLLIARDIGYLSTKDYQDLNNLLEEVMKMLNKLVSSLNPSG